MCKHDILSFKAHFCIMSIFSFLLVVPSLHHTTIFVPCSKFNKCLRNFLLQRPCTFFWIFATWIFWNWKLVSWCSRQSISSFYTQAPVIKKMTTMSNLIIIIVLCSISLYPVILYILNSFPKIILVSWNCSPSIVSIIFPCAVECIC